MPGWVLAFLFYDFQMFEHHLNESGKTYLEHGRFALKAGFLLLWAGIASIIHGLLPNLFPFVSRDIVLRLAEASKAARRQMASEQAGNAERPDDIQS